MADQIIKISQLNPLGTLSQYDFFPVDQSSSLTTYRTDINTLNTWFSVSGSASYSTTASYVENAVSASYVPDLYHQSYQSSCSWASASISSSYSLTSSAANSITFIPNLSNTASYITSSNLVGIVNSSSYSTSASYALTASYALNSGGSAGGPTFINPISVISGSITSTDDATWKSNTWILYSCPSNIIPNGTSILILEGYLQTYEGHATIYISPTAGDTGDQSGNLILLRGGGSADALSVGISAQGIFPCSSSVSDASSFYYYADNAIGTSGRIRIVGYY
jgi:hypothetical protein